jgi:hypothetical protein
VTGGGVRRAAAGTFDDHHRFLLARMLARVDAVDVDIAAVDTQIGQHLLPFADTAARLEEIPGIGPTAAAIIIPCTRQLDTNRFAIVFNHLSNCMPEKDVSEDLANEAVVACHSGVPPRRTQLIRYRDQVSPG